MENLLELKSTSIEKKNKVENICINNLHVLKKKFIEFFFTLRNYLHWKTIYIEKSFASKISFIKKIVCIEKKISLRKTTCIEKLFSLKLIACIEKTFHQKNCLYL